MNSNITWKIIQENPDNPWEWEYISYNQNITPNIIQANPDKPWNWDGISKNPNITWEIIQANPDKDWDWFYISQNPNISCKNIQTNPDKPWDWKSISLNKFNHDEFFQSSQYREKETHKMMSLIKEELISKSCHPYRILWYDDSINTDKTHPLYGISQKEINFMFK